MLFDVVSIRRDRQGGSHGFTAHIRGSLEHPSGAAHDLFRDADKRLIFLSLLVSYAPSTSCAGFLAFAAAPPACGCETPFALNPRVVEP